MKLLFVHQWLIGSAIGLCALFGVRSLVAFARDGSGATVALGIASFVALVGLALYLRRFRQKLAEQKKKNGGA